MKFKRIITALVLLAVISATAFAAGQQQAAAPSAAKPLRIAVVMPSATTDMAFSQSMWNALLKVQASMGGPAALELKYSENMFNVPDAASALRDYASQGFDIVIGHGSQYGSSIREVAPDFPEVVFAWGTDVNNFGMPNVYAYTAAAEQGGYVNGVLAALLNTTGRIGVTGPIEVGDAKTYIDGFVNGVNSVGKNISLSKTWTGSFSDVALMTAAAKTHIANGACREAGNVLWFGTQSDQASLAPSLTVASQIYDWEGMLNDIIANRKAGKLGGEAFVLTLANGGLKVAYNPAFNLPADVKAKADAAIAGIKNGTIKALP
jgi:basic membrane protein A